MKAQKKENYTLITAEETSFLEFYNLFSEDKKSFEKQHLVIDFSVEINFSNEELLKLYSDFSIRKEQNFSSVLICKSIDIDDFSEDFNIVPTLIEAEDTLEMEAIERELGF